MSEQMPEQTTAWVVLVSTVVGDDPLYDGDPWTAYREVTVLSVPRNTRAQIVMEMALQDEVVQPHLCDGCVMRVYRQQDQREQRVRVRLEPQLTLEDLDHVRNTAEVLAAFEHVTGLREAVDEDMVDEMESAREQIREQVAELDRDLLVYGTPTAVPDNEDQDWTGVEP